MQEGWEEGRWLDTMPKYCKVYKQAYQTVNHCTENAEQ